MSLVGWRRAASGLGLTLTAMGLLAALVVLCTLGQVEIGTFNAIDRYFRAFMLWGRLPGTELSLPLFPAGGAVGLLFLVNLTAVMLWRLPRTRRKAGLWFVHVGLALFVVGEFATGMLAVESQMAIEEGASMNYSEAPRRDELAVVDLSDPELDTVYAVRQEALREGRVLTHPAWPFTVKVVSSFANVAAGRRPPGGALPPSLADQGLGPSLVLQPLPPVSLDDQRNQAAAFLELSTGGKRLGTWLASSSLGLVQEFTAGGRRWGLVLRPERHYLPFTVSLKDFSHDLYAGTDIPKNFSSLVRLSNAATGEDRDVLIWMNHPLRYLGRTFYQASFGKGDTLSVLQVVVNPAWQLPYLSFGLVTLGLLLHFGLMLSEAKPPAAAEPGLPAAGLGRAGAAAAGLALLYAAAGFLPPRARPVDASRFGGLPVLANGRVKPLDTIARNSLLVIGGKQTLKDGKETVDAASWLLELAADPAKAAERPLFVVHDPDLLGLLGRREDGKAVMSWTQLAPHLEEVDRQAGRVSRVDAKLRTRFETAAHTLHGQLMLFHRLRATLYSDDAPSRRQEAAEYGLALAEGLSDFTGRARRGERPTPALLRLGRFFNRYRTLDAAAYYKPVPPAPGASEDAWRTVPDDLLAAMQAGRLSAEAEAWATALDSARAGDAAAYRGALETLEGSALARAPHAARRARWEVVFNRVQPFTRGMALYLASFLCAMLSYLAWGPQLRRAALALLGSALVIHTAGLAARMVLQGRPPVTNLYSSAVFVGWVAVLLAFLLERWSRRGLAAAVGAGAGFATLLIAHHLSAAGDTMEMMQAVLDSNFWLGTHVVTITIGYAATFLAGLLAHVWILRERWGTLKPEEGKSLYKMTYGTLAFALLFSFVGTVLGGIWADQSWGRFWGWDPKENGAFLIVLWCAIVLHARMGGFVRERGFMALTVVGCIVTALSWFGVNMLGIGLHSYGFMDKAAGWLAAFCASQVLVAAAAVLPRRA
ncbi:MAG: cytochrome c biogenesis protein CcsA [Elusimicrobia bacterium]|nr:cytochrome c biogenesis protein CcsA [Elusimicrobiota bacterium]